MNGLAYLGFSRIEDIERMGLKEYQLRLEAFKIRQIEEERRVASQAWNNERVKATKGSPKHPKRVYREFRDFFDTQKAIDEVRAAFEPGYQAPEESKKDAGKIFASRLEEFKRLKKAGKIIPFKERRSGNG